MSERQLKNGGWFHRFEGDYRPPPVKDKPLPPQPFHAGMLMHGWSRNTSECQIEELAGALGLASISLRELGAAYAVEHRAWAFPMSNARAECIGIRLRANDGKKWAVKGSKAGVFFPSAALNRLPVNRIYVCEGATDCAAALSIGLFAIGRHACNGQEEMIVEILRELAPREVVVIFDNDERTDGNGRTFRPGADGAEALCAMIPFKTARIIPPCKDLREFISRGATPVVIEAMITSRTWTKGKR